ncbi:MAG: phage terminase large subunit family protein [Limnohabitans sp.]
MATTLPPPSELTADDVRWLRSLYDPWQWAQETARIRLPKSLSGIDLGSRPFLRDVYRDMYPEIVCMKGAQLGLSTTAIIRALWMLTTFPSTVIYTFPSSADVGKYTQGRINPIIRGSQYLLDRIFDVDSTMQKQFRVITPGQMEEEQRKRGRAWNGPRGTVYFSGAMSEKDAVSIDADMLVHDEEDLSDPQIIEQFEHRLDASRFRWRFRLSTPRLPGVGIDRVFADTDKRRWMVRCPGCNAEFELAFPGGPWPYSNIEPDPTGWDDPQWDRWDNAGRPSRFLCHACGKTLTPDVRSNGQWVAERPQHGRAHGYAISQLAAPWKTAEMILQAYRKATWRSDFWNLTMGLPWEEGTNLLTEDGIKGRCGSEPMREADPGPCYAGIDVGTKFDCVVGKLEGGVPKTIWMGRLNSYDECDNLMRRFHVATCCIDAAPEEHATRAWAAKYNRYAKAGSQVGSKIVVWRVGYVGGKRPGQTAQVSWNEQNGVVSAPRTEILSASAEELLTERVLPRYDGSDSFRAFIAHHVASKKIPIWVKGLEDKRVLDHYEWHEVAADHQFHAATYEMMARMAPRGIAMPRTGMITTRRGRQTEEPQTWRPDGMRRG